MQVSLGGCLVAFGAAAPNAGSGGQTRVLVGKRGCWSPKRGGWSPNAHPKRVLLEP